MSKFFRRMFAPLMRLKPLKNVHQKRALKRVDAIEKGKLTETAPKYPTERVPELDAEEAAKIKQELSSKDLTLLEKLDKMVITSKEPPIPPQSKRNLPKRGDEYASHNFMEAEYGFYEPPLEKLEKNRLMFREALEIIRARMELVDDERSPPDLGLFERTSSQIDSHPAVHRVDRHKLELVWKYFRPFTNRKEQKLVTTSDLEAIHSYIEGADLTQTPYAQQMKMQLQHIQGQGSSYDTDQLRRVGAEAAQRAKFEAQLRERHQKEVLRLQKRMEDMKKMDEEIKEGKREKKN